MRFFCSVLRRSACLAGVCVLGPVLLAQSETRTLTGSVTNGHHEPLRGAVVQIEDSSTHAVRSYITDTSGRYTFLRLSGDTDYTVWAVAKGQHSRNKTLSQFDTHRVKVLNLTIRPK